MTSAWRNRLLLWVSAVVVIVADQVSKTWVLNHLPEYQSVNVFPWLSPVLSFTRLTNTGVAFGMLPQFGGLFTVLNAAIILVLIVFHQRLGLVGWISHLALGLQIGGALGNWIDRLVHGSVIDFIDVNFWPLHNWPVFNLADSAIVVGVTLLLISMWSQEQEPSETAQRGLSDA